MFQTNVHSTFKAHRSRKHTGYSLEDFKTTVLSSGSGHVFDTTNEGNGHVISDNETDVLTDEADGSVEEDFDALLEDNLASLLLCMQTILHVSRNAIQHIIENLNDLVV